jgi:hypothetical protein
MGVIMLLKSIASLITLALCSCSWNNQAIDQQQTYNMLPTRQESVGFIGLLHRKIRDSERASYDLMYGIRDGVDSFVYEVQKDYYDDYQK